MSKIDESILINNNEKIEKIKTSIDKLSNKKSKIIFCVPESVSPSASVYEIYFHASIVSKMGFETIILVEKNDYSKPDWIEDNLTNHKHVTMFNSKLNVGPEDILVIPEIYSNIMEQTKNLPCMRVGLLQSIDYMVNSLIPGMDWSMFNIKDVITTSKSLESVVTNFYGNKFSIKTYDVGIPDYFGKSNKPQNTVISIIGRNPNDITKVTKLFFSKYPEYNWVNFDAMLTDSKPQKPMRRIDFAKRLQNNFAAVWIDRISSFGTFPLECMKSGVIPICLKPDILPEYMIERDVEGNFVKTIDNGGVWVNNILELPTVIGEVLIKFLDDSIPDELYSDMDKIVSKYTQENSEYQLTKIYSELIKERIELFSDMLNKLKYSKDNE